MKDRGLLSTGLLKNSARRFWPLWLAYAVVLGLLFVAPAYSAVGAVVHEAGSLADKVSEVENLWAIARIEALNFALVASIIAATAYSDHLFSSRSATFVGSLPLTRATIFSSQYVAGLLPLLAMPAVAALCLLPLCALSGGLLTVSLVGQWLVLMAALTLVFYSFAQLACQLSGTRAVAVLLYCVINFLMPCLEAALNLIARASIYGLTSLDLHMEWLAPFVGIFGHAMLHEAMLESIHWLVIVGYVVAGLVATVLSCLLFVRRRFEAAGDSVAYAPARTFLKYLAGVSMALLFGTVYCLLRLATVGTGASLTLLDTFKLGLSVAVGGFLGVLFAEMILCRSARVLGSCWKGGLAVSAAALLVVLGLSFDVLGIERRVPDPQKVESVTLGIDYGADATLTSPDVVRDVCELQRDVVANHEAFESDGESYTLTFAYRLAGGRTLVRSYDVPSTYARYREGFVQADAGAVLVDRAAEISNSSEGRASRYATVLGGDPRALTMTLSYYAAADEDWRTVSLTLAERKDLIAGALRHDLMEGPMGALLSYAKDEESTGVSLEVLDADQTYLIGQDLSKQSSPALLAWVQEHHPEVLAASA